ncbi:25919_t:CDS:1, partial [Racocetra persica]
CVILWTVNPLKGIKVHRIWVVKDISGKFQNSVYNDSFVKRFLPWADFGEIIGKA